MSYADQKLTAKWVTEMFGEHILMDRHERAKRMAEIKEKVKAKHAKGITKAI